MAPSSANICILILVQFMLPFTNQPYQYDISIYVLFFAGSKRIMVEYV